MGPARRVHDELGGHLVDGGMQSALLPPARAEQVSKAHGDSFGGFADGGSHAAAIDDSIEISGMFSF